MSVCRSVAWIEVNCVTCHGCHPGDVQRPRLCEGRGGIGSTSDMCVLSIYSLQHTSWDRCDDTLSIHETARYHSELVYEVNCTDYIGIRQNSFGNDEKDGRRMTLP
ncbi:hypothetical protein PISMIDRAFT_368417 [Pisolithus microcarpus 441]|uniref:Uncharacterized protein n=1 Tax=Pisolithus microcarpus 441 TaxID=765257 RepID=A0A0C9ZYZ8_9AGAM|nr:hypothetical protein PISMIDRAFT_368417 [Pisolithus microcarpus 441]